MTENLRQAIELANTLLADHGLREQGWTFGLNTRKAAVGLCCYKTRRIELSRHYLTLTPWHEIEDTIRHEVAHAIAGPQARHGYAWKIVAMRLGARPSYCTDKAVTTAKPNWILRCPDCSQEWERYRLTKAVRERSRCPRCKVSLNIFKVR